jgi:hypothetical protein
VRQAWIAAAALCAASAVADDDFTLYELLAPDSHRFAITYDVTTAKEGDRFFVNPIRKGAIASDERVLDRASGKPLRFEVVPDAIKVDLGHPVPKDGERRIRIFKTYTDPKSYFAEGDRIVFDRGLSIRRNAVVLPGGYELVSASVPAIVSTEADGRMKASFVNDRDDTLPVRIVGRRAPRTAGASQTDLHRAEQDREITYWLLAPESGQFRISHDFTVARPGQRSVHSFVRKGSTVTQAVAVALDTGQTLKTYNVSGKDVNALGYYPEPAAADAVVVQADLPHPLADGESVRVRVIETYTDTERYFLKDGALVWDRTLGRPWNVVVLPAGWRLDSVSVPAVVSLIPDPESGRAQRSVSSARAAGSIPASAPDGGSREAELARIRVDEEGRVACRFVNPRNDDLHVVLKARRRP